MSKDSKQILVFKFLSILSIISLISLGIGFSNVFKNLKSVQESLKNQKSNNEYLITLNDSLTDELQKIKKNKVVVNIPLKKQCSLHPDFIIWAYNNSSKTPKNLITKIVKYIFDTCQYPKLTLTLIQRESALNPFAVSSAKAKGLGQVTWKIWKEKLIENNIAQEERDLFDWKVNILATDFVIRELYKQHQGNWDKILNHYVGGDNNNYISDIFKNIGKITLLEESNPMCQQEIKKQNIEVLEK